MEWRSKRYYKEMNAVRKCTQYEFFDKDQRWLGSIDKSGNIIQAINVKRVASVLGMEYYQYLIKLLGEGHLCGEAENLAINLKMEVNKDV